MLDRLLTRISSHHKRYEELTEFKYRLKAGFSGEVDVDRVLHEVEFPQDTVFKRNIKLQANPHYKFEIDTLIITPSRVIILEVKKYSHEIYFDEETGKTIKVSESGKIEQYDCAVHQLLRTETALRQWMVKRGIEIPIESIIVMANQRTIIKQMPKSVPVKYRKQLPRYIRDLPKLQPMLSGEGIQRFKKEIQKSAIHDTYRSACDKYHIHPSEIKRGVLCAVCNDLMNRRKGQKWRCRNCGKYAQHELEQSLEDWFLLIKPVITNAECRRFLKLPSKYAASKILRQSKLKREGNPPKTIYFLSHKNRLNRP